MCVFGGGGLSRLGYPPHRPKTAMSKDMAIWPEYGDESRSVAQPPRSLERRDTPSPSL